MALTCSSGLIIRAVQALAINLHSALSQVYYCLNSNVIKSSPLMDLMARTWYSWYLGNPFMFCRIAEYHWTVGRWDTWVWCHSWSEKLHNRSRHLWSGWIDAIRCLDNPDYHKCPKYSGTQTICCNHSKIWTMWLYLRVMSPNDADGMANSVDPDQTSRSSLIWVCTVCPGISVWKLKIITAGYQNQLCLSQMDSKPRLAVAW